MDNELWRWVWVVAAMVMGLGEIFTAGFFLLPFGIGAALAAVAAWIGLHGAVQWLLFFGGTAVSMLVLRRFMGRQDRPGDLPVGANRYIGMTGRVVETIDEVTNAGRVRVESDEWRAVAATATVAEGSLVQVTALHGTKLEVELVEPPPEGYVPQSERTASATGGADAADADAPADAIDAESADETRGDPDRSASRPAPAPSSKSPPPSETAAAQAETARSE